MSKESREYYIKNNDFLGAKERLENTSPRWIDFWFEACETIFNNCPELASKYKLDSSTASVITIICGVDLTTKRKSKYDVNIFFADDLKDILDNANEKCYLFEFYDEQYNIVCSKVGTTNRRILTRLREELRSKTYAEAAGAVVLRVYDCGEIPAEGLESYFRAKYIQKYPKSFCKNDRFYREQFDLKEADKIAEEYFKTLADSIQNYQPFVLQRGRKEFGITYCLRIFIHQNCINFLVDKIPIM